MLKHPSMEYLPPIFLSTGLLGSLLWRIDAMNKAAQFKLDSSRKVYEIVYPRGTTEQMVVAFLQNLGGGLRRRSVAEIPTVVSEVRWTASEVKHILRIPPQKLAHVTGLIEAHLNGATVNPIELPDIRPTLAVEVSMTNTERMLRITDRTIRTLAVSILHSVPTIRDGEVVDYQIIVSHTDHVKYPVDGTTKLKPTLKDYLLKGNIQADKHELTDRQRKAVEQNYNAGIRISVETSSEIRARELIGNILDKLRSAESNDVKLKATFVDLSGSKVNKINLALTPSKKGAQLTVTELAALIAAPIGDPAVPGLMQGAARRIAPTEAVAREGRLLGHSNISGRERPVALSYEYVNRNTIYIGGIGSGKSVGMANNFYDDVKRGMGAIVIDASASESAQSLYSRAKGYIPTDRIDDVIDIHVRNNAEHPVAFDLFKQGLGMGVIDQVVDVFTGLYPDIAKGVTVRELLYHGLWTLIESDLTIVDLEPLLRPKTAELNWAKRVVAGIKDPELREFWERMKQGGWGSTENAKKQRWDMYTDPLYRRLWQLVGRPEIRYMVGQSEGEGLNWERVLTGNKIVLISLAGLPPDTAQLLANLLVNTLWTTAQRFDSTTLKYPNSLYMDEFQVSASIRYVLDDLLARGRKHGLPITLGTQYLSGIEPRGIQTAVLNNVMNRVIYPLSSSDEAMLWRRNIGSDKLTEWDFQNGQPFEPIVQLRTDTGNQIVTIKAEPPREPTGNAARVSYASEARYGVPVEDVRLQTTRRRAAPAEDSSEAKQVGPTPYQMPADEFEQLGR